MMTSEEIRAAIGSMGADELEAYGLVRGPVDSEGVMWHSGDMSDTTWGVIEGIAYSNGTWYVRGHDMSAPWMEADSVRHYHEPTVEELLEKALNEAAMLDRQEGYWPSAADITNIVNSLADKLQLKGVTHDDR